MAFIMYKQICILLCLLKIAAISAFVCEKLSNGDTDQSNEKRLKDDLLCNYNKYFLPLKNQSGEMNVKIDMNIDKYWITSGIPGVPESLHLSTELTVSWNDVYLKWSPDDYSSINQIIMDVDDIWKPEIKPQEMEVFSNMPSILEDSKCIIKSNGNITCEAISSHFGYCESELFSWPYEIYQCSVQYSLWSHNGEIIKTDIDENKTVHINENNTKWKIINTRTESYSMKPETNVFISEMYFHFEVEQDMNNAIQLFYITLFTLVSLTLLSFWTCFEDTNRMVLILLNIICHTYEIQNFEWHMSSTGKTIPFILTFYRDSLVLTFIQLVETVALKKIITSGKQIPYLILLINKLFNYNIIKQILFIHYNYKMKDEENEIMNENNIEYIQKCEEDEKREKLLLVDRLFFIIFLIIYFIMSLIFTSL